MRKYIISFLIVLVSGYYGKAQEVFEYKIPSEELAAPFISSSDTNFSFSRNGQWILSLTRLTYPSIEDIAFNSVETVGLSVNALNFSPANADYYSGIALKDIKGKEYTITGMPEHLRAGDISWSPDEKKIAFTQKSRERMDLYVIDLALRKATKVNKRALNISLGRAYEWMPDNSLVYKVVLNPASMAPSENMVPAGAFVYDSKNRTSSDILSSAMQSQHEIELFRFYTTTQLVRNRAGKEKPLGAVDIYSDFTLSPDGNYIMVTRIEDKFSRVSRFDEFPVSIIILDKSGQIVKNLISYSVDVSWQKRARFFEWRPDKPATLTWVQPCDSDPSTGKERSYSFYSTTAPFTRTEELFNTTMPLTSINWSNDGVAVVNEIDRRKNIHRISLYDDRTTKLRNIHEQKPNDLNDRLGNPVMTTNKYGRTVVLIDTVGQTILVNNISGNAESGQKPFLAKWNYEKKTFDYLLKSPDKRENVIQVISPENSIVLLRRQNEQFGFSDILFQYGNGKADESTLNDYSVKPPYDSASIQRIQYKRKDGLIISGTLYLPEGYDKTKDGPLPLFLWSYPRRYLTRDEYTYSEPSEKTYGISIDTWEAPQMFVSCGYAVLDANMPIIPDSTENANDSFIEQLVMNAEAAIDKLAGEGIADPERVAVGGHSYGGSMTALLLANTDLFRAGIAMSGAYNRLNTPFGFQDETRTYWEAENVYERMNAYGHADKIKTPLLLIHGTNDKGAGTEVAESEGLYKNVSVNGGTVRLVKLPFEGHGFKAKETILHLIWEIDMWLGRYVKNETYQCD